MATNTSDFFTFSKTAGTAKNLQKPTDGGDNNLWGGYINVDLDTIVGAVNATSDLIADANQNELVDFTATGSAVNHVGITNAATGNGPTIEAKGDDTNIDLNVSGKGTGVLKSTNADFTTPKLTNAKVITGVNDTNGNELVKVTATGSAVNEITVANAATGNGPTLSATGDDTNIDLNIAGKGTGEIEIASNIAFSNDTDAKIKLPSGGGIYESDGSTEILTESSGAVTLKNTTLDSTIVFPSDTIIWVESGITNAETGVATGSLGFTTTSDQMKVNITASNAGLCSKIIIMFHTSVNLTTGSSNTRFNARIARVRNGVTEDLMDGNNWYAGTDGTGTTIWSNPTIIVTDTSPNGTHDHSYEFQVRKGGGASNAVGNITPNHAGMAYLIMGVK